MKEALIAYRSILRAVDKHITAVTGNPLWRNHIIEEFRKNSAESSPSRANSFIQLAKDHAFLLNSIHEYKVWLKSCQIITTLPRKSNKYADAAFVQVIDCSGRH